MFHSRSERFVSLLLARSGFEESMSFRTATFLFWVSIALVCGMDRAIAAESLDVSGCVAARSAPAPRNAQWRYHFDQLTGQKCWRLARVALKAPARKALPDRSGHHDEGRRSLPRSVADAQASLLSSSHETSRAVASASHRETIESATSQPPSSTFESRWLPAEMILFDSATTTPSSGPVPILDREEEPASDAIESKAERPSDSEQMIRLLGVVLMSVGIALGLSALIGAAAASWLRARDRAADPRSRLDGRFFGSSPPLDSTISDIVERLSEEDALSEAYEAEAWEAESARLEARYSRRLISHHSSPAAPRQVNRNRR
jgi:hypothetical protein